MRMMPIEGWKAPRHEMPCDEGLDWGAPLSWEVTRSPASLPSEILTWSDGGGTSPTPCLQNTCRDAAGIPDYASCLDMHDRPVNIGSSDILAAFPWALLYAIG